MKTHIRVYDWTSPDDMMPDTKDLVLIWRYDMPFIGYYDIANNWWVIDGVSECSGIEYWKDIQRP
ncbi:hypothetical protein A0256_23270 [Mucilaginibacter sp. PAMC 26640]|nr:hypothetical protein A0256_23270 [Mucilaginibacter sp. PAMC 26640]